MRCRQTNSEGQYIDWLHEIWEVAGGVVVNPAAWTHYSYAIRDAVELLTVPVVEVHLSNVDEREDWRRVSVISDLAARRVVGKGPDGYQRSARVPRGDAVVKDRLDRLQAALEEPLLVSSPVNVRYLCGLDSSNAALLVEPDRVQLFTDFRYAERAGAIRGVEAVQTRRNLYADLAERLSGRVGFETEWLTHARFETLAAGGLELVPRRGLVERLRQVKDGAELAAVRRSAAILNDAFARLAEEPFVGRSERDIVWRMAELIHEGGADDAAFSTAVGSGPTGASPHALPGDRRIEVGETVVVDAGCRVNGYCSDCTRTFVTGPLPAELQEAYDVVSALRNSHRWRPSSPAPRQGRRQRRPLDHRGGGVRRSLRPRPRSRRRPGGARGAVAQPELGERRSSPATSSPSSPASTSRVSAASASRTSSSSPTTAPRC